MRYTYQQPNNPLTLLAGLLSGIPELAPKAGAKGYKIAVFRLLTNGDEIAVDVDDDVAAGYAGGPAQLEADIGAVVASTDPTPPPPPPDPDEELAAAIQDAATLDELKAALLGKSTPAAVRGRRVI